MDLRPRFGHASHDWFGPQIKLNDSFARDANEHRNICQDVPVMTIATVAQATEHWRV